MQIARNSQPIVQLNGLKHYFLYLLALLIATFAVRFCILKQVKLFVLTKHAFAFRFQKQQN